MDPVTSALAALIRRHSGLPSEGTVADYIPELAVADSARRWTRRATACAAWPGG